MEKKTNKYQHYKDVLSRIKTQQASDQVYPVEELELARKGALEYVDQLISDAVCERKKKIDAIEETSKRIKRTKRKIKKLATENKTSKKKKKEEKLAKLQKKRTELRRLNKNLRKKEVRWRGVYSTIEREEITVILSKKSEIEAETDNEKKKSLFNLLFPEDDEKKNNEENSILWSGEDLPSSSPSSSSSSSPSSSEEEEEKIMIVETKIEETEADILYKKIFPFGQFWEQSWTWAWNKYKYTEYEGPALYIGKKDNTCLFLTKSDDLKKKKQLFVVTLIHTIEEYKQAILVSGLIEKTHGHHLRELYEKRRFYAILPGENFVNNFRMTEPELLELFPVIPEEERKWPLQIQSVQYFGYSLESVLLTMTMNRKEKLEILYLLSFGLAELKRIWGIEYNALSVKNICIDSNPDTLQNYYSNTVDTNSFLFQSPHSTRLQYSSTLTQRDDQSKEMLENEDYSGFSALLPFMGFNTNDLAYLQNLFTSNPLRISFDLLQNALIERSNKNL